MTGNANLIPWVGRPFSTDRNETRQTSADTHTTVSVSAVAPREHGLAGSLTDMGDSYKRGLATRPRLGLARHDARPAHGRWRRFSPQKRARASTCVSGWPQKNPIGFGERGILTIRNPVVCETAHGREGFIGKYPPFDLLIKFVNRWHPTRCPPPPRAGRKPSGFIFQVAVWAHLQLVTLHRAIHSPPT